MEIHKYISELLYDHDCVIIPGFGGFVANYHSARINTLQNSFHPPYKKILFNKELKTNDGLLASHIAISEKIPYELVLKLIEDFSLEITNKLEAGEKIVLENIGELYLDDEINIQFKQDYKINYLNDSFGLGVFISPPVQGNIKSSITISEKHQLPRKQPVGVNKALQSAAHWSSDIAAAILFIGLIMLNFNSFEDFASSQTSLIPHFRIINKQNPSAEKSKESASLKDQSIPNSQIDENITDAVIEDESLESNLTYEAPKTTSENLSWQPEAQPLAETEKEPLVVNTEVATQRMYYLIAGSFEKTENADNLINMFAKEGYTPKIIGQADNGFYRVSIAAFFRKEDAIEELAKVREKYNPSIWLLRL